MFKKYIATIFDLIKPIYFSSTYSNAFLVHRALGELLGVKWQLLNARSH